MQKHLNLFQIVEINAVFGVNRIGGGKNKMK